MWIVVLWNVPPFSLARGYQRLGRTCRLHLQDYKISQRRSPYTFRPAHSSSYHRLRYLSGTFKNAFPFQRVRSGLETYEGKYQISTNKTSYMLWTEMYNNSIHTSTFR